MKNLIVVAIAAISLAAVAQTNSTTNTNTTAAAVQPAAMTATPAAKKAKNTAKKSTAAVVTPAAAMPATTEQGTSMSPAGEKSVTPSDAAGTSTTSLNDAAPTKKWKGSVSVTPSQDEADVTAIQVLTKTGLSYKIADKLTVKAAQTFETLNAGASMDDSQRELIKRSNFRSAWTDLSVSTSGKGILGSNDIAMSLNYRKVSGDAVISQLAAYAATDALIDLNINIPYTLNPKFDLSIDTQIRHAMNDNAAKSGYRLLAVPTLSYNVNDKVSIYQGAGMMLSIKDNTQFRRSAERLYIATGLGYAATKSLSFDLNVSQDKAIYLHPTTPFDVTPFQLYHANAATVADRTFDSVSYEASVAYNF